MSLLGHDRHGREVHSDHVETPEGAPRIWGGLDWEGRWLCHFVQPYDPLNKIPSEDLAWSEMNRKAAEARLDGELIIWEKHQPPNPAMGWPGLCQRVIRVDFKPVEKTDA